MLRSDFHYDLPRELIAQHPLPERSASRLLCLDGASGALADRRFDELPRILAPGDLLVFNDTRVIRARLSGVKASGGRVEVLVECVRDEHRVLAHVRANRPPKAGVRLILEDAVQAEVTGRMDDLFELTLDDPRPVSMLLDRYGHVPLPPYIARPDDEADSERYQTVYARRPGAVAAPTAGLHFDAAMLERLRAAGIDSAFITLHVGAGTFRPVQTERLEEHPMHPEFLEVSDGTCAQVRAARARGGRVVAVGTTVVRALESAAARSGEIAPFAGDTALFIYPGHRFAVVDALVTNFHLPESTLLMLVCAFGGYHHVMNAYRHAVQARYRFYSYGDAMFVTRKRD